MKRAKLVHNHILSSQIKPNFLNHSIRHFVPFVIVDFIPIFDRRTIFIQKTHGNAHSRVVKCIFTNRSATIFYRCIFLIEKTFNLLVAFIGISHFCCANRRIIKQNIIPVVFNRSQLPLFSKRKFVIIGRLGFIRSKLI